MKFGIYSSAGVLKAEGYPTFTGTYLKAGVLEFREICSPTPINWEIGDFVGYMQPVPNSDPELVRTYPRTGLHYSLYNIPQVKKQAASQKYGGAYVYQNVQFLDATAVLDICPFRDLVVGDNRVHFSTQPAISVFDNVAGIAERLQACLEDMYGTGSWAVVVSSDEGAPTQLMAEERDFVVSNVTIRGALEKVYEVWPEVGWVFSVVNGVNTITLGAAGLNGAGNSYEYGKGNGLLSLTRTVANPDELANRLYVYGSARNMRSNWYSQFSIKDAASVDIEHLMLPINAIPSENYAGWGKTNVSGTELPDPAKAFIQDAASITARGLRPKTVYFDGSGDYKEIYPSIQGVTAGEIRSILSSSDPFYPDPSIWPDSARVDKILSVESTFDSGLEAPAGKSAVQSDYGVQSHSGSGSVPAGQMSAAIQLLSKSISNSTAGKYNLTANLDFSGSLATQDGNVTGGSLNIYIRVVNGTTINTVGSASYAISYLSPGYWLVKGAGCRAEAVSLAAGQTVKVEAELVLDNTTGNTAASFAYSLTSQLSFLTAYTREKTFKITLRQVGFDIAAQAALGDGKSIAMRTGNCVGRTFKISSATYNSTAQTWTLEVFRVQDDSLSQWFPNTSYPIAAGDEFVLLDIAMPALYVSIAELRLLAAAKELLADTAEEQWQYNPEIDAKYMVENNRTILPAQNITIVGDIVPDGSAPYLVDSVTINEGDSTIPTYKVTLRDKKKKSYSDKASVETPSGTSVGSIKENNAQSGSESVDWFIKEEYTSGQETRARLRLNPKYDGMYADGFVSAGGLGEGGGGGTGGARVLTDLNDVYSAMAPTEGQAFIWRASAGNKWTSETLTVSHISDLNTYYYTKTQVDALIASAQSDNLPFAEGIAALSSRIGSVEDWLANPRFKSIGADELEVEGSINLNGYAVDALAGVLRVDGAEYASKSYLATQLALAELPFSEGIAGLASRLTSLEDWLANPALAELFVESLNVQDEINGNAASATKLKNARNFYVQDYAGVNTGQGVSFDGTDNALLKLPPTIGLNILTDSSLGGLTIKTLGNNNITLQVAGVTKAQVLATGLSVTGNITASDKYFIGGSASVTGWDNGQYLTWDSTRKAWHLVGNFYADGFIAAGGYGTEGSGGGGLVETIYKIGDFGGSFSQNANDTFNAYAINSLYERIVTLESGAAISVVQAGNGNVVTSVTKSGTQITVTKGTTLGTAATYSVGVVATGNTGLVTGGDVYSAINTALSSAIKFRGITTTALTDGATTNPITIDGNSYTAILGDEVIYGNLEFLWTGSKWQQLGDEQSWALKTITITGTGYLTGGGDLTANRTIDLTDEVKTKVDNGSTAYGYFSNAVLPVSHGGTGLATLTTGYALIGNGTDAVTLRAITNNTSAQAVSASTNLITANTLYYHTGNSNISTVGTITSGTWQGTAIANDYLANHSVTIAGNVVELGGSLSADALAASLDLLALSEGISGVSARVGSIEDWLANPALYSAFIEDLSAVTATFGGAVELYSTLSVVGAATLASSLAISGNTSLGGTLSVSGDATLSSKVFLGASASAAGWTNGQYLIWDATNKAWHLVGNFYADGFISAGGLGSGSGGGGLIETVYRYSALTDGTTFTDGTSDTFNAYTIKQLADRIVTLEGGAALSVVQGNGNYVIGVSKSGTTLTVSRGTLATVATSGSYNDLSNKPTIPAAQVQSDWAQTNTSAVDYIKNKPDYLSFAEGIARNSARLTSLEDWLANPALYSLYVEELAPVKIVSGDWNGNPIANAYLANSSITLAGRTVSLGGSISAENMRSDLSINNVENTKLSTWTGTTNITTLGTITTGTWNGSSIAFNKLTISASDIQETLGTTPVYRAYSDSNGLGIATNYQLISDTRNIEKALTEGIAKMDSRLRGIEDWFKAPAFDAVYAESLDAGKATFAGAVELYSTLSVAGAASMSGALSVSGLVTANGGVNIPLDQSYKSGGYNVLLVNSGNVVLIGNGTRAQGYNIHYYASTGHFFSVTNSSSSDWNPVLGIYSDRTQVNGNIVSDGGSTRSIGTTNAPWGSIFGNKWYPRANDSDHYIEFVYNSANDCYFRIHGTVAATGGVSAGA